MNLLLIIAEYLRQSADNIENNSCNMTTLEILYLASTVLHEELNKTLASEFLNISSRSFDRKVASGELPKGLRIAGQPNLCWFKDELLIGKNLGH